MPDLSQAPGVRNPKDTAMQKIHVDARVLRENTKTGERKPPISVAFADNVVRHASAVDICDYEGTVVARVVYHHDNPDANGAKVWIETKFNVFLR